MDMNFENHYFSASTLASYFIHWPLPSFMDSFPYHAFSFEKIQTYVPWGTLTTHPVRYINNRAYFSHSICSMPSCCSKLPSDLFFLALQSQEEIQFQNSFLAQFFIAIFSPPAITISIYWMQMISFIWNEESNLLKLIHISHASVLVWVFTF